MKRGGRRRKHTEEGKEANREEVLHTELNSKAIGGIGDHHGAQIGSKRRLRRLRSTRGTLIPLLAVVVVVVVTVIITCN